MNLDDTLPALRALEITPFRDREGRVLFELRDARQIAPKALAISGAGYFVLAHLDGTHTLRDVLRAFREATGQELPAEEVVRVIAVLDHYAMLATPRFDALYAAWRAEYEAAECRENVGHSPSAEGLRQLIRAVLDTGGTGRSEPAGNSPAPSLAAEGPAPNLAAEDADGAAGVSAGGPSTRRVRPSRLHWAGGRRASGHADGRAAPPIRGVIAPHLDYPRGAPCYAAAYSALISGAVPDRFVILGTNHFGCSTCAVMTGKDFRTPLGRVRTDRAFIRELEQALGSSLRGQECDHRAEHSVELQVQMLQVCFPEADFVIVPVLCPNVCGETGLRPADGNGPDLGTFADELAAVVAADAQRTVLIAGADFSHVGQTFGDARPADAAFLAEVERVDRGLLDLLARDEPDGFLAALLTTSNRTRACSSGCLYALRRALRGRPLRVLAYHQATDPESDTNVTCAAAVIE